MEGQDHSIPASAGMTILIPQSAFHFPNFTMRTGPDYIQFYPTLRCNQACGFCFNKNMPAVPDMPVEQIRTMLTKAAYVGVRTIDIMGGEPTLHQDIVECVREARKRGLAVNLSSNGSHPDALAELMTFFPEVTAGISINDWNAFELLREFMLRYKPVVKSVFSPGMDRDLIDSLLLLNPGRYYLIYRDALDWRELSRTVPFYEFVSACKKDVAPRGGGMVFCSGFIPGSGNPAELSSVRCPAGTTKLGVLPDGSVYPCNLWFGNAAFLLGNILSDPFESIWNHRTLAFFRSAPKNSCSKQSCELHAQCHGGCPAQSVACGSAISAPDPRCRGG